MNPIKLTIGLPHFDDYDGVVFSVQSLMLHQECLNNPAIEILVIDNSPATEAGKAVARLCQILAGAGHQVRYVALPGDIGPSGAKNAVFEHARGEFVMCMDCHVLLPLGTVARLMNHYKAKPDTKDYFTGPLIYDDLRNMSTHFDQVWRGEMWGIWATDPRGNDFNGEPFDIWGNGCGLFSCRKDAWLGFNPHWRGFGGEEGYIHEKFRQAGRRVLCIPWLRWWHRFGRPNGVKYVLTRWNKIRNYVLGHAELGLSLDPIHEHFVKSGLMPQHEWDYLIENPVEHVTYDTGNAGPIVPIEQAYQQAISNGNSYFNQHMPKLRELAAQCESVSEITRTTESTLAIQASRQEQKRQRIWRENKNDIQIAFIEQCELLFFKPRHEDDEIEQWLTAAAPKVTRWIAIHDLMSGFASKYQPQVQAFLDANPEWFVYYHTANQFGFTVLGRRPEDQPAKKIVPWILYGPGTELSKLLADIGINPTATCSCKAMARDMDAMGIEGCRANLDKIVEGINKNQEGWGWKDKLSASFKVAAAGYFSIQSLVEEAIRRAELISQT